ncbi:tol-pal system-associated acyl-CoA thioesterase [Paucibacter sediminis]|uniref:Tol-pal system-associated acyl-CoA thioesterase n=1 Tax=Paucibacter sediminis TaxID=3019553 RepID=A0AA95NBE1_9BURK|nr:tol-pal system-associated acyl-CoA thioesterase [Paucibacter sp. S2-9]WIT11005.1 tol-pal system-associated acyl-CoA thioesterase [Paucibacter sp. S2-9]
MTQAGEAFEFALRVYWEDTDAGGVVFYANYLKFFERARTEWLRALGFEQERLRTELGALFVVGATNVRYLSPARLDDQLRVTVKPIKLGRVSMDLAQQAWRGQTLLAESEIRIGCVGAADFKPTRIPAAILQAIAVPAP